jgi:hypothetical protein
MNIPSNRPLLALLIIAALLATAAATYAAFQNGQDDTNNQSTAENTEANVAQEAPSVMFPIPEYGVGGGLVAILVCIAAFAIYRKRANIP